MRGGIGAGRAYVAHARPAAAPLGAAIALAVLCFAGVMAGGGEARAEPILKRGDAAVTGFAGTRTDGTVPDDVHPLDRTFIDLDGSSLRIFDLSNLGTAPRGQLSDVAATHDVKARDVGQVFGITLDDGDGGSSPNLYVTATSMFGLQIVAPDGKGGFDRLLSGAPGARFMPGQFGLDRGGTPGSIYRIDGATGAVSLFANVKNDGRENAGPGLGNIAFDGKTRQVFVSDLETGLIHRFTMDGTQRDTFDHGETGRKAQGLDAVAYDPSRRMNIESPAFVAEDSATWGFADERRRVFGLAVSAGRLYYAVAEGPSVWSVSIDEEGDFGTDARIELEMAGTPPGTNITAIAFDGAGMMYLAQRGAPSGSYDYTGFATPQQAAVVRYRFEEKEGRWAETPQEYAVGLQGEHKSTLGGVALSYGYDKFGRIDYAKCRQTMWTTGEHLRDGEDIVRVANGGARTVHGLQGVYKSRVRPQNVPPYESWFTDYDGREDAEASYGLVGALAIYAPCDAAPAPEGAELVTPEVIGIDPPEDDPGLIIDKRCFAGAVGAKIRCTITVRNTGDHLPVEDVEIMDVTRILAGPGAGGLVPVAAVDVPFPSITCTAVPTPDFSCTIPASLLAPGSFVSIDVWVDTHDLALAGNLGFRNCVTLEHPDGYGKACAQGGTDIVVEKIGPGVCQPGGTCKFGLRIANVGLMPFDGDVLLADAMFIGGGAPAVPVTSVSPPIACSAGDTAQLPFSCQTHLSLMPGEETIHWIEVTMPAPGGYEAENCFGALDPLLIPAGPLAPGFGAGGAGNPSCVTVVVPVVAPAPMEAKDPPPPVTLVKIPRCPDGRARLGDGTCPCAKGARWNTASRQCEEREPRCSDPDRRKDDGSCCARGTYYDDESGRCRRPDPVCADAERRRDDGSCCPLGTVASKRGDRCVSTEIVCPQGTRWHYVLRTCVPLRPQCDYGERYDWRRGECRPLEEDCGPGMRYNRTKERCEESGGSCGEGTHWSRRRQACVPDETRSPCPDGSPRLANGGCRCPLNRRWNEKMMSCESGTGGTRPGNCLPGERFVNGRCVKHGQEDPGPAACPEGKHRVGKFCVHDRIPGGNDGGVKCPDGKHRVGKFCLPDRLPPRDEGGKTPPSGCPAGKHKVGRICIPDKVIPPKVIKDPPKVKIPPKRIDVPPKKIVIPPKREIPNVKIKPVKPPVVRSPPNVKVKPPRLDMPGKGAGKGLNKGRGIEKPAGKAGGGQGLQFKVPKGLNLKSF